MLNKRLPVFISFLFISLLISVFCYLNYSNDIKEIKGKGFLLVGTTGDYCPMSCFDSKNQTYVGFDIALAEDLGKSLGIEIKYVQTSWPTLMEDITAGKFDIAISGITVTDARKKQAYMSKGYLDNGKTVLCRKEDVNKYTSIDSINHPNVRVMENPGGLNEKFARENLPNANLIIHNVNYEIPNLIALDKADVMITEIIEANYYSNINRKLAAPLAEKPFTKGSIGMLIPKNNKSLLIYVNNFINQEKKSGRIDELKKEYIYVNRP